MDSKDKIEYAPEGMFPEDDDVDTYDISAGRLLDKDLDVWDRGSAYTWGKTSSWWSTSGGGATSSMWGGTTYWSAGTDTRRTDALRLAKHKTQLDSLCKVVDPTVKHTLSFGDHRTGATNMETGHIVLDGSLLKKDDKNLDITCGLAIHEKLHLVHSKPLYAWQQKYFRDNNLTYGERDLFHSIENIIEDEYIESQLQKTCGGFVTYIEAVKRHYFNDKAKALEYTGDEFADVVNTLLMLVRYPSMLDTERRKRHAPHINYFLTQLKTGIDSRDNTYKCILGIYIYLKNVFEKINKDKPEDEKEEAMARATEKMESIKKDFEKDGLDMDKDMVSGLMETLMEDAMRKIKRDTKYGIDDKMRRSMESVARELSDYKELIDALTEDMTKEIKDVLDSDYEEVTISKELAPNSVHTKITWQKAMPDDYHIRRYRAEATDMKKTTGKLRRKIDLYGDTQKLTIRNQKRGKIDKRMLHRIPMGRLDLFKADIIKTDKPLDVCLLIDESGSMGSYTMAEARRAAISLKEALADNPKLNLWVFGHTADRITRGDTEMTEYWSPSMKDRPMAMGAMKAKYENRDGSAIVASADRIKLQAPNPSTNKLMIVLSDGEPSADAYRGEIAQKHTASCVKHCEARGWNIIQVGFSGAREHVMKRCFTNWIYVRDETQLGDKISKIIRKVLKV